MGITHKSTKKTKKIPLPSGKLRAAAAAMREVRLAEISRLATRGLTAGQISDRLGLDTVSVRSALREVEQRWKEVAVENVEHRKASILRELDLVKAEAWEEWERSKDDRFKQVVRTKTVTAEAPPPSAPTADATDSTDASTPRTDTPSPSITQTETTTTREGRLGDPAYLRVVADCLDQQSRLLGLEVEKVAMTDPTGQQSYHGHVMGQLLAFAEECRSGPAVMSDAVIEGHVQSMLTAPAAPTLSAGSDDPTDIDTEATDGAPQEAQPASDSREAEGEEWEGSEADGGDD